MKLSGLMHRKQHEVLNATRDEQVALGFPVAHIECAEHDNAMEETGSYNQARHSIYYSAVNEGGEEKIADDTVKKVRDERDKLLSKWTEHVKEWK